jgi:uncharacterized protein (TIGR02145 family)
MGLFIKKRFFNLYLLESAGSHGVRLFYHFHLSTGDKIMRQAVTSLLSAILLIAPAVLFAGNCGDVNNSGTINILDITYLINYVYKGGPEPDCGPETGTIVVDPSPDSINAPWSLTGPDSYSAGGAGDDTLLNLAPGDYTVTWGYVAGWITPAEETRYLSTDETVIFSGIYEEGPGTVVIDPSPDSINAPWSVTGPGSYSASGAGDDTLADLAAGDYTVTWEAVPGWLTPAGEMKHLAGGQTIAFSGIYEEEVAGTVTDIDGNVYQTIKIGDQWWMAENLKVTHYRNGDPIPNVTDAGVWSGLDTGACCNYNNEEGNVPVYGRLYNWYTVNDGRNIAPEGWHVPSDGEWQIMADYLGGDAVAGGKMKETGTTHWVSPNTGATNESGFTALPGGFRNMSGAFYVMTYSAYFWSSTEYTSGRAWYRSLIYDLAGLSRDYSSRTSGFSVRCVRD